MEIAGIALLFIWLMMLAFSAASFAIWIWMLIDCITKEPSEGKGYRKSDDDSEDKEGHKPVRQIQRLLDQFGNLQDQPANNSIGPNHMIDPATHELR